MSLEPASTGTSGAAPSPPLAPAIQNQLVVSTTDPNALAPVLVLPRMTTGLARLEGEGDDYQAVSLDGKVVHDWPSRSFAEAMDGEHPDDAHFVCYGATLKDGSGLMTRLPRLTKPGLFDFKRDLADEVFGAFAPQDYDLPGHAEWTKETLAQVQTLLEQAGQRNPIFKYPTVCYRTAHGLRLAWAFSDPVPLEGPGGFEDILHGMLGDAWIAGFPVDPACKDWTRLFRLPRVVRDGVKTSSQPYFSISYNKIDFTVLEQCPAQVYAYPAVAFRPISQHKLADYEVGDVPKRLVKNYHWDRRVGHAPEARYQAAMNIDVGQALRNDELVKYLFINGNEKRETVLLKAVKREVLAKTKTGQVNADVAVSVFRKLFEDEPMFCDIERKEGLHETILKVASFLSMHCNHIPGVTPQVIYALVLIQARKANGQRQDKRPDEVLCREVWSVVSRFWCRDISKKNIIQESREWEEVLKAAKGAEIAASNEYASAIFLKYLKSHAPDVPEDMLRKHLQNLLILRVPQRGYFVASLTSAGEVYYSRPASTYPELLAVCGRCGHDLIEITKPGAEPDSPPKLKFEAEIVQEYGTLVDVFKMSRLIVASEVRLCCSDIAPLVVTMVEKMPGMKRNIKAHFHPEVDAWLTLLGGDNPDKLKDWLAVCLRLDRPIAGLYLGKTSGAGKGMLTEGLRFCTESEEYAEFKDFVDNFQDTACKTPLVVADEYVSQSRFQTRSVLNEFKKLVTGEYRTISIKGKAGIQIEGYWRVLFTANRDNLLNFSEDVNQQDMEALALRVIRIIPSKEAKEYLEKLGGWTATESWPRKEIPEHIQWLSENRVVVAGSRLLVQGENRADAMGLNINSPTGDLIVRAIDTIMQEKFDPQTGFFSGQYCDVIKAEVTPESGVLHVGSLKMHRILEEMYCQSRSVRVPAKKVVADSLHALSSVSGKTDRVYLLRSPQATHKDLIQSRVCQLDLVQVIRCLDRLGEQVDFRQNGFLSDEWYQKNVPEIFAELPPLSAQAPVSTPVRPTPNSSAPSSVPTGIHPGFATALRNQSVFAPKK